MTKYIFNWSFTRDVYIMDCLDKSIEHWERILEFVKNKDVLGLKEEGWRGKSCACCAEFNDYSNDYSCEGCPIMEYTGEFDCINTPWWQANSALNAMVDNLFDSPSDALEAVTNELDFLKKVRDSA